MYSISGDGVDGLSPRDAYFSIDSRTGQISQLRVSVVRLESLESIPEYDWITRRFLTVMECGGMQKIYIYLCIRIVCMHANSFFRVLPCNRGSLERKLNEYLIQELEARCSTVVCMYAYVCQQAMCPSF